MRGLRVHSRWLVLAAAAAGAAVSSPGLAEDEFFFIHVSDVHAYRHSSQVDAHYGLGPAWLPRVGVAFFALRGAERMLVPRYTEAIMPHLRTAIGLPADGSGRNDLWDAWSYFDEVMRPGSALGEAETDLRAAFAEMHALAPAFLVNTGDIVFDSTKVPRGVSLDWAQLLLEAAAIGPAPVHHTIGNHELGLIQHEDASPDDPLYGPGFFRQHFGPSPRAWDQGAFRFVALDTHSRDPESGVWRRNRMRPEVRAWFERELRDHPHRVVVVLNHEPFFIDAGWNLEEAFADTDVVDAEGLLERYAVPYTLTGHVHLPGAQRDGSSTHIATGALSGMHWILPPEAAPRGYRLFYARERRLYTVWKRSGEPVVGFLRPVASPDRQRVAHVVAPGHRCFDRPQQPFAGAGDRKTTTDRCRFEIMAREISLGRETVGYDPVLASQARQDLLNVGDRPSTG